MKQSKILFVDDNANILSSLKRQLGRKFDIETAEDGPTALELIKSSGPFAVIVSDQKMPGMDGVSLLKRVLEIAPDITRIMLTGNADQTTAIHAVNEGQVFQFLTKPYAPEELEQTLKAAIENYQLRSSEKELLNETLKGITGILSDLLSVLDPEIHGKHQKIREQIVKMLPQLNIKDSWEYELAATLAPIGFITLPDGIRAKVRCNEKLTEAEQKIYDHHPVFGFELLKKIPRLQSTARGVLYQNKSFDGSGFPLDEVAGQDIPLVSRILNVLSSLNQLEEQGDDRQEAVSKLKSVSGKFDPEVLELVGAIADYSHSPTSKEISEDSSSSEPPKSGSAGEERKSRFSKPFQVGVEDLQIGHIVIQEVRANNGVLLLKRGNKISEVNLQRILNYHSYSGIVEPIFVVTRLDD